MDCVENVHSNVVCETIKIDTFNQDINDEFFASIIETKLRINKKFFIFNIISLAKASGQNENFLSTVYRAKIKVDIIGVEESQIVEVIIKMLLNDANEIAKLKVFQREAFMYENVLRTLEAVWKDNTGEIIEFAPKSVEVENRRGEVIVLDDLQTSGYKELDREEGLNLDQAKVVLIKLAKFHAASAVYPEKDSVDASILDRKSSVTLQQNDPMVAGILTLLQSFCGALMQFDDCQKYLAKIAKWNKIKFVTAYVDVAVPMANGFKVLNHGDLWMNNLLFREGEKQIEMQFIDFQLSFWGSPAGDLLYFLISSISDEFKIAKFDELIECYHEALVDSLKRLNYVDAIPTLDEIHADLLEKGFFASSTCLMLSLLLAKHDSDNEINLETFLTNSHGNGEMFLKAFLAPSFEKAAKMWLEFLDEKGFLDRLIDVE